jgi:hypothetical protein
MSLYISQQNQEILWNIINKNNIISQYFLNQPVNNKHEWFKSIIHFFYNKYIGQSISVTILTNINKETITYMIQDIKSKTNPTNQSLDNNMNMIHTPEIIPDNKQQNQYQNFNTRVKDYEQMTLKTPPPDINFSDKPDEHITDMDNMLKLHISQRDQDLQTYQSNPNLTPSSDIKSSHVSIKIHEPVVIDTGDIIVNDDKKTVSWDITTELTEIKENITELFKQLSIITEMMSQNKQSSVNNIE